MHASTGTPVMHRQRRGNKKRVTASEVNAKRRGRCVERTKGPVEWRQPQEKPTEPTSVYALPPYDSYALYRPYSSHGSLQSWAPSGSPDPQSIGSPSADDVKERERETQLCEIWQKMYQKIDSDGDGAISREELTLHLKEVFGQRFGTSENIQKVVANAFAFNDNNSGNLDDHQFLTLMKTLDEQALGKQWILHIEREPKTSEGDNGDGVVELPSENSFSPFSSSICAPQPPQFDPYPYSLWHSHTASMREKQAENNGYKPFSLESNILSNRSRNQLSHSAAPNGPAVTGVNPAHAFNHSIKTNSNDPFVVRMFLPQKEKQAMHLMHQIGQPKRHLNYVKRQVTSRSKMLQLRVPSCR